MAIFDHGSVSLAADRLNTNQGNVSRTLGKIEEQVGIKLFVRHRKGLRPTMLGTLVVGWARMLLNDMDEADRDLNEYRAKLGKIETTEE